MNSARKAGQTLVTSRRTHRKSRMGCSNCKRRRIKCDEKKPACTNCVRHSIRCDFESVSPSAASSAPSPGYILSPAAHSPAAADSPPSQVGTDASFSGLELIELELLQHYMISTYKSLGGSYLWLWKTTIPQLGFSHHFILQLLLAFSALDLARSQPERSELLRGLADEYQHAAVQAVTALLPDLNAENSDPLYVASLLICSLSFAKGPVPGDYLMISDQGASEWLVLNRGTRSILELQKDVLWSGRLSIVFRTAGRTLRTAWVDGPIPEINEHTREFHKHLVSLAISEPNGATYLEAWNRLVRTLKAMLDDQKEGETPNATTFLFSWIYCLEENFILCLQQHQPVALVMLSYFVVMLHTTRDHWFFHRWPEHIMTGICHHLPEDHKHWIRWPAAQLGWAI